MELFWIILAGCGGGLLLVAYVAFVVYKIFRHKKRVQMTHYQDPERLTDDKVWTVHVNASKISERRADGLCMDTMSGSTKRRRKASIPSLSETLGVPEEVPQSVLNLGVPIVSPQTNPTDKQNERSTNPSTEPKASAGTSPLNLVTTAPRSSPEIVQRFEYTWETLLRQPSGVRKNRSQSLEWDDPEYRKPNGTTRSMKFDKEGQGKRAVRSKSLRGYTHRELALLNADETVQFDTMLKRKDEHVRRNKTKKSLKEQRAVTDARTEEKKDKDKGRKTSISRSGSAPSTCMRAKGKVVKDQEGIPRPRNSFRWIPEPDYQTVSIEEVVSANQQQDKATSKNNACVVEIHNVPGDRHSKVNTSMGTVIQVVDPSSTTSFQQSSRFHEEQTNSRTTVDVEKILPVPGVAKRVPTVLNDQTPDENEETKISINTHERRLSIQNHVQNLETQITDARPNPRPFQATISKTNYTVVTTAPSTTDINNNSTTLPDWRQKQTASDARQKPKIDTSQTGQPLFKTKPEVRSIGKMTIVKHVETPARRENSEITPNNPKQEDPSKSFDRTLSTQTRQSTDTTSPRNSTLLVRNAEEPTQNETSQISFGAPPPPPPPPSTMNPRSSDTALCSDVKITISSRDNQDVDSEVKESTKSAEPNVPVAIDMNQILEERKKTWKREEIVDKLHSARARNANQNYIFGTGLAYQSCMPELQNKLKQLALAK